MRRQVQRLVEDPLAEFLLSQEEKIAVVEGIWQDEKLQFLQSYAGK